MESSGSTRPGVESSRSTRPGESGWVVFAGVVMIIIGSLDALWGLAGILNDDILVVGGQGAIIADITFWGWVHLLLGAVVALTGFGLLAGNEAARWFGVFFLAFNAIFADRLVPGRTVVGVPDHHPRRCDHLPADRPLGYASSLGVTTSEPAETPVDPGRQQK